jgi:hypothetical protein
MTPETATKLGQAARALFDLMQSYGGGWDGACHALSSIGYVVLREHGIDAAPCLGEALRNSPVRCFFDHSWLEVEGLPIDVAIGRQLEGMPPLAPVVAGQHIDDGRPSEVEYGVASGGGLTPYASEILRKTIGKYMDDFPGEPNGLWDLAIQIGASTGVSLDLESLHARYDDDRWVFRGPPRDSADERRRARNQRKQEKRRRR